MSAGLEQKSLTLQANALYCVHAGEGASFGVGADLRYRRVANDVTVAPGPPAAIGFLHTEDWVAPALIAPMTGRLDGPWSMTPAGDVGGSAGGSALTWQLLGTVKS